MAEQNGSIFFLNIDGNPVGASTSFSWAESVDLPDTSNRDTAGFATHLQGLRSISGSCDLFSDPAKTVNVEELFDLINTRSDFTCLIIPVASGTLGFTGTASISNLEMTFDFEQPVGVSFSFQVNGQWSKITQS